MRCKLSNIEPRSSFEQTLVDTFNPSNPSLSILVFLFLVVLLQCQHGKAEIEKQQREQGLTSSVASVIQNYCSIAATHCDQGCQ